MKEVWKIYEDARTAAKNGDQAALSSCLQEIDVFPFLKLCATGLNGYSTEVLSGTLTLGFHSTLSESEKSALIGAVFQGFFPERLGALKLILGYLLTNDEAERAEIYGLIDTQFSGRAIETTVLEGLLFNPAFSEYVGKFCRLFPLDLLKRAISVIEGGKYVLSMSSLVELLSHCPDPLRNDILQDEAVNKFLEEKTPDYMENLIYFFVDSGDLSPVIWSHLFTLEKFQNLFKDLTSEDARIIHRIITEGGKGYGPKSVESREAIYSGIQMLSKKGLIGEQVAEKVQGITGFSKLCARVSLAFSSGNKKSESTNTPDAEPV